MPINPITGAPLSYSQGGGTPMAGPQPPQGAPGRMPMWAGGGANPGFGQPPGPPPGGPQGVPPPGAPGAPTGPPGMPLGLTPELLAMIQARMAKNQFRPGPEDSLIPTGGSEFDTMRSGDY